MSPRSDTTNSWDYAGHLLNRSSLAEFLKTAKLRYLEIGIGNITFIVKKNLYLAMSLKPGYRVNTNLFHFMPSFNALRGVFSSALNRPAQIGKRCLRGQLLLPPSGQSPPHYHPDK